MSTVIKQTQQIFCILIKMKEEVSMVYREALPYLLKQKGWSYRELDWRTGKSASYWNQTVTGTQAAPKKAAVYEALAELFGVEPRFFQEYTPLKASELVLKDPGLAYIVIEEAKKRK